MANTQPRLRGLVTGASHGLGRAISSAVSPLCERLYLTGRDAAALKATAKQATATECLTHIAELADAAAVDQLCSFVCNSTDRLDFVVLNAGYYQEGTLCDFSTEDIRRNFEVHCVANQNIVGRIKPLFSKAEMPRVFIVGSTASYEAYEAVPNYGVIKWALRGFYVNLRRELLQDRIGVTFLAPGPMWTNMWEGEPLPRERLLEPEDVAALVPFALQLHPNAVIDEVIIRPLEGDLH